MATVGLVRRPRSLARSTGHGQGTSGHRCSPHVLRCARCSPAFLRVIQPDLIKPIECRYGRHWSRAGTRISRPPSGAGKRNSNPRCVSHGLPNQQRRHVHVGVRPRAITTSTTSDPLRDRSFVRSEVSHAQDVVSRQNDVGGDLMAAWRDRRERGRDRSGGRGSRRGRGVPELAVLVRLQVALHGEPVGLVALLRALLVVARRRLRAQAGPMPATGRPGRASRSRSSALVVVSQSSHGRPPTGSSRRTGRAWCCSCHSPALPVAPGGWS